MFGTDAHLADLGTDDATVAGRPGSVGRAMDRPSRARVRAASAVALRVLAVALLGAVVGLAIAVYAPTHVEIAGSDTRVWLEPGRAYDQFGVEGVLTAKRATTRSVLGQPL